MPNEEVAYIDVLLQDAMEKMECIEPGTEDYLCAAKAVAELYRVKNEEYHNAVEAEDSKAKREADESSKKFDRVIQIGTLVVSVATGIILPLGMLRYRRNRFYECMAFEKEGTWTSQAGKEALNGVLRAAKGI